MSRLRQRLAAIEAQAPPARRPLDLSKFSPSQKIDFRNLARRWHREREVMPIEDLRRLAAHLVRVHPRQPVGIHGGSGVNGGCACGLCESVRAARWLDDEAQQEIADDAD